MADTSNLTKFLGDVADAIRTKKETTDKIPAEQFDQEILSIETGSGNIPVKLFETEEQMQADETAEEGDLALVYREEIQNASVDSKFSSATFPNTVVLDTAITDYVEVRYRAVDDSAMFDCWGQLDPEYFMMDCYTENSEVRIQYESSDGKTYTRIDDGDELVDFGTEIYYYRPEYWNDAIGYFIQTGGNTFDGLYKYQIEWINENQRLLPLMTNIEVDFANNVTTFDTTNNDCSVDSTKILKLANKIADDNSISNLLCSVFLDTDDKLHLIPSVGNKHVTSMYSHDELEQYPAFAVSSSTDEDVVYTDYVLDIINETYIATSIPFTTANYGVNNYRYCSDIILKTYPIDLFIRSTVNQGSFWHKTANHIGPFKLKDTVTVENNVGGIDVSDVWLKENKYILAPTQLTLSDASQLLPGKIAYGKTGAIEGDGSISIHIPSMIKDLFGNNETLNIKYLTVDPYSNETKKYTLCERDEANVALALTQPGEFSSSPAIFYQNGTNKNYYVDGEYYYIAKQGTTDVLTLYQLDKQFHLIHTYTINIPNVPTGTTRKGTAITKYNDTWHLLFVNGGSTTSFSYGYGTFDLETSSYTSILSGTKAMQSTSSISLISPWLTAYGNKIGFGVVQIYKTSSSGAYNYKGHIAFVNLDSGEMTTVLDATTLVSNQSMSYTEHIVTAMNDKYLAFHITYFNADSVNAAYNLSYNFETSQSIKSTTVSENDDLILRNLKWIDYLGEEYAWAFNSTYAARLQLSTGKADILTLDKNPVYMDETNSYGIAPGVIYNFEGDQYTIEENPLVEDISSGFFTKLLRTDNYIANLGIKTSKIYWYAKIEETDSYDIIATNSTTTTCVPMVPYFTAPAHKFKLDEIYFGKVYEDTISPVEYDTALETAQDILGKEVTE